MRKSPVGGKITMWKGWDNWYGHSLQQILVKYFDRRKMKKWLLSYQLIKVKEQPIKNKCKNFWCYSSSLNGQMINGSEVTLS